MNSDMMRKVADAIERDPDLFDQNQYGFGLAQRRENRTVCLSAACVAGWAGTLAGRVYKGHALTCQIHHNGMEALDIDEDDAARLFSPTWPQRWFDKAGVKSGRPLINYDEMAEDDNDMKEVPPQAAAAILRMMADDGRVWKDWEEA